MKTHLFFTVILLSAFLVDAISCQKNIDVTPPQSIHIISGADIVFKAIGGKGDITIEDNGGILTATTQQCDWCHLSVNGNTIHVIVDDHFGEEGRDAVIKMKAGESMGETIIHQLGVIVRSVELVDQNIDNKDQDIVLPYDANETVIVATTDADWLTVSVNWQNLTLHAMENVSKEYREAHVNWNIGQMKGSFTVSQFDPLEAGLTGAWTWNLTNVANNRLMTMNANLSEKNGAFTLELTNGTSGSWSIPVVINGKSILIPLGEDIGSYNDGITIYRTFPLIAAGTTAITYADGISTGCVSLIMSRDASTGKWTATQDAEEYPEMNLRFEMFTTSAPAGTSGYRLAMKNIRMVQGERLGMNSWFDYLCSTSLGGRFSGSLGIQASCDYICQTIDVGNDSLKVVQFTENDIPFQNIVFHVDGKTDSTLVFGAHYDAYGYYDKSSRPGADDNLSGVAVLLCLVNSLKATNCIPKYNIDVCFWDGEEIGRYGSKYYVRQLSDSKREQMTYVNVDTVGNEQYYQVTLSYNPSKCLSDAFCSLASKLEIPVVEYNPVGFTTDCEPFLNNDMTFVNICCDKIPPYLHSFSDIASNVSINQICKIADALYDNIIVY